MQNIEEKDEGNRKFLEGSGLFLRKLFDSLAKDKIDVSKYKLDHICYRVETVERYEELKELLSKLGKLLSETQIGGRPIATYKLNEPILFEGREIDCLELPSPKESSFYPEGYEHAEFVIDLTFEDFMKKYPDVRFDTRAISKPINADIGIKYGDHTVKFHHQTLEYVIENLE